MKKVNIKYSFFLLLLVIMGSCKKDFLQQNPYSSLGFDVAIIDEASLQTALNGAYASLRNTNLYGRTIPVIQDLMADNIYVSTKNSGRYLPQWNYQVTLTDGSAAGIWASGYNTILRTNLMFEKGASITGTKVSQYLGEAYAIRALVYFELVKHFAKSYTDDPASLGVPIVTTYNPSLKPARNTVAEVYTQIINDLDAAISKLSATNKSTAFSLAAAKGLKAKILFYKGDYTGARDLAKDVIDNGGYSLVTSAAYNAYWSNPNSRTDKVETLFEVSADPLNNNNFDALARIYTQAGYGDMLCTNELYNLYSATDIRRSVIIDGVRAGTTTQAYIINKYTNSEIGKSNDDDTKVLRLSEVYLIYAESAARTSQEANARIYLNNFLLRRDPTFVGYSSTGSQLIEDIITERRKELAFEGNRWADLNRLKRDITRNTTQYPSTASSLPYTDFKRILPIPQAELDANKNMAKNPGY